MKVDVIVSLLVGVIFVARAGRVTVSRKYNSEFNGSECGSAVNARIADKGLEVIKIK